MIHTNRRAPSVACLLSLLCLAVANSGCNRWVEVKSGAIDSAASHSVTGTHDMPRVPAILTGISVSQNGVPMVPAGDLEHRVLDALADTQLFSQLVYPEYSQAAPTDPHVRAKLTVALFPEPHAGAAAWKGMAIGASMFLLAPVLPLEYEYGATMTLDLEQPDGEVRRYTSQADGIAHYHLFGATHLAVDELKAQILENCLAQLRQELVQDRLFVQAGYLAKQQAERAPVAIGVSAHPTDRLAPRQIRTISILRSPTP